MLRIPLKIIGETNTFEVEAHPNDTVGALRHKVRAKLRLKKGDAVQLVYGGEWLSDERRLSEIGVDGKMKVGVELTIKPDQSITVAPKVQKQKVVRSVSIGAAATATPQQLQVIDPEPMIEDDIFDTFRYLTTKYYRWSGKRKPPSELHRYKISWSLSTEELNDLDSLVELGYRRPLVVQVYMACGKNVITAANVLLAE